MNIILPGADEQIKILLNHFDVSGKNILIFGHETVRIGKIFSENRAENIFIITEDEQALLRERLFSAGTGVKIRLMQFAKTDFDSDTIDLVYAQGSISGKDRSAILSEAARVLRSDGIFASGEVVLLKEPVPAFVRNVFKDSGLNVLTPEKLEELYVRKNFILLKKTDLSHTLKDYYQNVKKLIEQADFKDADIPDMHLMKMINRVKHQANVYLKLGGNKFTGYYLFLLRKNNENI